MKKKMQINNPEFSDRRSPAPATVCEALSAVAVEPDEVLLSVFAQPVTLTATINAASKAANFPLLL